MFTITVLNEALEIAAGFLEGATSSALPNALSMQSNPKLTTEIAIASLGKATTIKANQSTINLQLASHLAGTAKLAALMKMDGDLLGKEHKIALDQKLTLYIDKNINLQARINRAVKRLKKIDAINKSGLTNLLTIGIREALILVLASSMTGGVPIAIGASAGLIRNGIKLQTHRLKGKVKDANNEAIAVQQNQLLLQRSLSTMMLHAFLEEIEKHRRTLETSVYSHAKKSLKTAIHIAQNSTNVTVIGDTWESAALLTNTILGNKPIDTQQFLHEQHNSQAKEAKAERSHERELQRINSRNSLETAALISMYSAKKRTPLATVLENGSRALTKDPEQKVARIKKEEGAALDKLLIKHNQHIRTELKKTHSCRSYKLTLSLANSALLRNREQIRLKHVEKELKITRGSLVTPAEINQRIDSTKNTNPKHSTAELTVKHVEQTEKTRALRKRAEEIYSSRFAKFNPLKRWKHKNTKRQAEVSEEMALEIKSKIQKEAEKEDLETLKNECAMAKVNFIEDKILVTERQDSLLITKDHLSPSELSDIDKLQALKSPSSINSAFSRDSRSFFSPRSSQTDSDESTLWSDSCPNTPTRIESNSLIRP